MESAVATWVASPVDIPTSKPIRKMSTADSIRSMMTNASAASSVGSINFAEGHVDPVRESGLRHSGETLIARKYKTPEFVENLIDILNELRVKKWHETVVQQDDVKIRKVTGCLTNAVFFVSSPALHLPTLLLRIYGPSSGALVSRPRELHTLHILSSQYRIGPRVYGTFGNGRVEEYFDSMTLTTKDIRDPQISRWIGARMAELHSVDVDTIEDGQNESGKGWEIGARKNVREWLLAGREVMTLPRVSDADREELDLDRFADEWDRYMSFVSDEEKSGPDTRSRRVFAHNDAQYGNLLRLAKIHPSLPEHHQIVVVDFEYASPNPAAFDIANHFHEWTTDYNSSLPHLLYPDRYPTESERRNFLRAYVIASSSFPSNEVEESITSLERQIAIWSPAPHAMWAFWGIVQAREAIEGSAEAADFDCLMYAKVRMAGFRAEIKALGV